MTTKKLNAPVPQQQLYLWQDVSGPLNILTRLPNQLLLYNHKRETSNIKFLDEWQDALRLMQRQ